MRREEPLNGHTSAVMSITITDDSSCIISGSKDNSIIIWSFSERKQECILKGHLSEICSLIATSGYIISGSKDRTIRFWNLSEKKEETC